MPVALRHSIETNYVPFVLTFQDADAPRNRPSPLPGLHVRVDLLDDTGESAGLLFQGRTDHHGEVQLRVYAPFSDGGQPPKPLPKVQVLAFDLDREELANAILQPERNKPLPAVRVSVKSQVEKINSPLNGDAEPVLGRRVSSKMGNLLKDNQLDSLKALRGTNPDLFNGFSGQDRKDYEDLAAHARLQLISRDHKLNQSLIEAGFRDVFAIARLSRAAFLNALKGRTAEKAAAAVHELSLRKVEILKNRALEKRVSDANGYGQPKMQMAGAGGLSEQQPCTCDCQSAISPLAYLADLLDFVLREVTYDDSALKLDRLEDLLHQPFASLPVDCSASEEIVRQVRICIEVLRSKAVAEGKASGANAAAGRHASRAYGALLTALGTSSRELRLLRGTPEEDRKRKAQSLGIATVRMNDLLLQGNALTEPNLETIFGLQDTSRDPLSFGAKLGDAGNHILRWQLKGVDWRRNTDENGRIYARLMKQGNKFTLTLFKDSARSQAVAGAEGNRRTDGKPSNLTLAAENDSGLYGMASISHQAAGKDFELAAVPQLLIWQLRELIELWQEEDHPEPAYDPQLPIIDPDMLEEAHFCRPLASNEAHKLWRNRQTEVADKYDELDADSGTGNQRTVPEMIEKVWGSNPPDWGNIETDLLGKDEDKVENRIDELKVLHLSVDAFAFLNELRKRSLSEAAAPAPAASDPEIVEREKKERAQAIDILVDVVKRRDFYPAWKNEENDPARIILSLSPAYFCTPADESEPAHPLRVSLEQRSQWLRELERNCNSPIVDPDILHSFRNIGQYDGPAENRRRERQERLDAIQSELPSPSSAELSKAWLDERLGTEDLKDSSGNIVLHALGLESIDELQAAFDNQRLDIQSQQNGLTRREINALFTIRKLVTADPGLADAQDWSHVLHILIQAEKRRYLYPIWRTEETEEKITLSPEFFRKPDHPLLRLLSEDTRPAEWIEWRSNPAALRAWRSQLEARFRQQASAAESLRSVVDRAEETTLPELRDSLIDVVYGDPSGASRGSNIKQATNTLLIHVFESGCRKTTRVAQAFESIQLLVWGILNHQIEDPKFSIPDQNQDDFEANWHWLQSYATWRAAMFFFLYPENILLPRLRPEEEQTPLFKAILDVLDGKLIRTKESSEQLDQTDVLSEEEAEIQRIADEIYALLEEVRPQSAEGIWRIAGHIENLRQFSGDGNFTMTSGPTPFFIYNNTKAHTEDRFYLPLHYALTLHQSGDYESGIRWFRILFDFNGGGLNTEVSNIFSEQATSSILHYNADFWLNDRLNPHLLASTRQDLHLRFMQISIIRCLLDYAEAEFTIDTSESVARARELYLSAQRLLESDGLKQTLPDCEGSTGTLILEVGETYRDKPNIRDAIIDGIILGAPEIDPDRTADLLKDLNKIVIGSGPGPRPLADIKTDIDARLKKHTPKSTPIALESRIDRMGIQQDRLLGEQLKDPRVFEAVLQIGTGFAGTGIPAGSVRAMGFSGGSNTALFLGGRDLVRADEKTKVPGVSFEFCIPPNPILIGLSLRTETGLFKLSHCMNLAGLRRELPAYAGPTDTRSGMPIVSASGTLSLPVTNRLQGTRYRYRVLVERAKQLLGIAQQLEGTYLSFLEKLDQENYTILRARHDLGLANANVTLQDLRVTEAEHGKELTDLQEERAEFIQEYYDNLINAGMTGLEYAAVVLLWGAVVAQSLAVFAGVGAASAATGGLSGGSAESLGALAGAAASGGNALSTASSAIAMSASFERRAQEWEFQRDLAELHDLEIAKAQVTLAQDHIDIAVKERDIAHMNAQNAGDVVNFLSNKFTGPDLYNWMGSVVCGVYRYFLQQSTATAKLAQMQLSFERQEAGLEFILSDYWTVTTGSGSLDAGREPQVDRRGMTGSARLLHDLYRMDQHAFTTDRRKLQLGKTISLALHDPIAFQQFRQTGVLPFITSLELFDRDFPGHYLRLIKRVRTSVIALIPPAHGIKATLSSPGISRVVVSTESGGLFEERAVPREPEFVSLTAPSNDIGVFELQEQPDMLLPFEGLGVANSWEFRLPKAANAFDFSTIADVLITIDYAALDSPIYRRQVIQQLDPTVSADRPFSFRRQFADAWYDLHNPEQTEDEVRQMVVSFVTRREDFPPNVSELKIEQVSLLFAYKTGDTGRIKDLSLSFTGKGQTGSAGGSANPDDNGIASTRLGNAGSWKSILTKLPVGEWTLSLRSSSALNDAETRKLFEDDQVEDILFVITFSGVTSDWPL